MAEVASPRQKARRKLPRWALPLLSPARYKGIKGGRGGGKSHVVAEIQVMMQLQNRNRNLVCVREVQKSLKFSSMQLIADKIKDMGVSSKFTITTTEIRTNGGTGRIIFQGMSESTAITIKSLEGMDCAWVEEAQALSKKSLRLLRPTIRKVGSELWFTWNPLNDTDAVDEFLCGAEAPPDAVVISTNWEENPFLPEVLRREAELDRKNDPIAYAHVWEGEHEKHAEARIMRNWRVEEFDVPGDAFWRYGLDWGFGTDPLVCVGLFIVGRKLYIRYEAWRRGCQIDDTRSHVLTIPGAERGPITGGSDRPERVAHARSQRLNVYGAVRGPGSEQEGIDWINNHETIIHPDCEHTIDEFKTYKHPIDPATGLVVPILPKKAKNDCIEAVRYAGEDVRRAESGKPNKDFKLRVIPIRHHYGSSTGSRRSGTHG